MIRIYRIIYRYTLNNFLSRSNDTDCQKPNLHVRQLENRLLLDGEGLTIDPSYHSYLASSESDFKPWSQAEFDTSGKAVGIFVDRTNSHFTDRSVSRFDSEDNDNGFLIDLSAINSPHGSYVIEGGDGFDTLSFCSFESYSEIDHRDLGFGSGIVYFANPDSSIVFSYRSIEHVAIGVQSERLQVSIQNAAFDYTLDTSSDGSLIHLSREVAAQKSDYASNAYGFEWRTSSRSFQLEFGGYLMSEDSNVNLMLSNLNLTNTKDFVIRTSNDVQLYQSGRLEVSNSGSILVESPVIRQEGFIKAPSGRIELIASSTGYIDIAGHIDVSSLESEGDGGTVLLLGYKVSLIGNSMIDASGYSGGGHIHIGRDRFNNDKLSVNSQIVYIGRDSSMISSSYDAGNGGEIIVWSDRLSFIHGSFYTHSFGSTGDAGFIETSSAGYINLDGVSINSTTVSGRRGTWLIESCNISIVSNGNEPPGSVFPKKEDSRIDVADIVLALESGIDVTIATGQPGSPGNQYGNITLDDDLVINAPFAVKLTLIAAGDVIIRRDIVDQSGLLSVSLVAGRDVTCVRALLDFDKLEVEAENNITICTSVDNLVAKSRSGFISVYEMESIILDRLDAAGGVKVVAGDAITIGSLSTPKQAELKATSVMTSEGGLIAADRLLIDAQGDVTVKTTVSTLDARSRLGSIEVVETDSIRIDRLESALGASVTAGDAITIVSLVTPEQAELIARSVMTSEGGSIAADRLLINAQDNVSVTTTVGKLDVRSVTGSIEVIESDSIIIDRIITNSLARISSGGSIESGTDRISADQLTVLAQGAINLSTDIRRLDAKSQASDITVREIDSLEFVSMNTPGRAEIYAKSVMTGEDGSITAERLLIEAQDDVSVKTTVGRLDAGSRSGSIEVVETESIQIDRLGTARGVKVVAGDAITIVSLATPQAVELRGRSVKSIENGSIQADRLTIAAEQEVDVRTAIASLDARSSQGSVTVNETDSIRIDRLESALGASVTAGDAITIVSLVTPEQADLIARSVMTSEGGSIAADRLLINAQDNISLTTTVGVLDAISQSGSIDVVESDSIIIDRIITNSLARISSGGSIESGTYRISADKLTVLAQGAINLSTAIRLLDAKSQASDITVREIDSLEFVSMNTPGRAEIYAKSVMTGANGSIAADRLIVDAQDNVSVTTNVGRLDARSETDSIEVVETDSIAIDRLESAGGVKVVAKDAITIGSLLTPKQAELKATSVMTSERGLIAAERLLIDAQDNISLTTTVGVLDAISQSGSIDVVESDSIIIDRIMTNSLARILSGGSIESGADRISADQLTVLAQGAINLSTAIRRLDAKSQASDITVREIDSLEFVSMNTPGRAEIYAKSVMTGEDGSIAADRLLIDSQDDVSVKTTVGRLDAGSRSGSIEVVETESIQIDRLETARVAKVVAGDAITIVSLATPQAVELRGRSVKSIENGSIHADRLTIAAEQEVDVRTAIASLDARSSQGSVTVTETDSIRIDRLESALGASVTAGDAITIVSLTTPQAVELRGRSVKSIENGSIHADRLTIAAEQEVDVRTAIASLDARSSDGSVTVNETDSIRIDRLESALSASVTAGDAITIVSLVTPQAVELRGRSVKTIGNGSIQADRLTIAAEQEVDVRTAIASLDARSSQGSVTVTETDSIRIDRLESALGTSVTAGDAITIVSLVTPEQADLIARSVMTSEGGSIAADRLLINAQDNISLTTTVGVLDAISQSGSIESGTYRISADQLTVLAQGAINLSTSIRRLDAKSQAGDITVKEIDSLEFVSMNTSGRAEIYAKSVMTGANGSIAADRLIVDAQGDVSVTTTVGTLDARSVTGSIEVIESDSIIIDRIITNSLARISSGGSIESGTDRISADQLTVLAQGAINLSTAIRLLDAKSQAGDITVRETDSLEFVSMNTPGRAEIYAKSVMTGANGSIAADRLIVDAQGDVSVTTTVGTLDARSVTGSVEVMETDSIDVVVIHAGKIARLNAQKISIEGDIQASRIEIDAKEVLTIENHACLATESGYVFGSFLNYQDKSNPNDTRVIDPKQTKSLRNLPNRLLQAEIQLGLTDGQQHGEPGKVMASGLKVEFDWGAGKGNGPERVDYPNKTSMFTHRYFVHPNALNPSEDIIVKLKVSDLAKGTIVLNEKGSSLLTNQKYQSSVIIPVISTLPVFAVAIPQPSTIVVPQRPRLQVDTAPVTSRSSIILSIDRSISSIVQVTQKEKRIYLIAEVSPESGRDDKRNAILLKNNRDTDEYQTYDLKKLPELFKRLPDNRYQILMREGLVPNQNETFTIKSTDRIILDVIIKDGQARSVPLETNQDQFNDH